VTLAFAKTTERRNEAQGVVRCQSPSTNTVSRSDSAIPYPDQPREPDTTGNSGPSVPRGGKLARDSLQRQQIMPNLLEDRLGLRLVEQAEDGRDGNVNDGEDAEDHCPMGGDEGHGLLFNCVGNFGLSD